MTVRMTALAVTAVLLLAASGCTGEPTSPQPSASAPLDDMRTWAPALATGKLLTPQMQAQRLQTVEQPGIPPQDGYGLGIFNLGG